jgi:hypothetical protein
MICEQIRESIDRDGKSDVVSMHVSACAACRQYEAEMSSLLSLLGAQPRVQAPADFETRLQARLASKEIKVLALVNSLPAVEAPANFDFQLRGRLAQTKASKTSRGVLAWVEQVFAHSFSLGQAASAMAAVALVVAFSVVQFNRGSNPAQAPAANQEGMVAMNKATKPLPSNDFHSVPSLAKPKAVADNSVPELRPRSARHLLAAVSRSQVTAPAVELKLIASSANERVIINAKTRQEMKFTANEKISKFVPAPKVEPMNEVF